MTRIPVYKKTTPIFILHELGLYLSQIIVFCIVGILASDFLKNEERLVAYANTRINENSWLELFYIMFATLSVIGLLKVIDEVIEHRVIKSLITDVVNEIPKIIYFFGSSVAGVIAAIALFLNNNTEHSEPAAKFVFIGVFFAVIMFIYGAGMSYLLKKKTHIKRPNKSIQPPSDSSAD